MTEVSYPLHRAAHDELTELKRQLRVPSWAFPWWVTRTTAALWIAPHDEHTTWRRVWLPADVIVDEAPALVALLGGIDAAVAPWLHTAREGEE